MYAYDEGLGWAFASCICLPRRESLLPPHVASHRQRFQDTFLCSYLQRKAKEEARSVASATDAAAVETAVQQAQKDLVVWKRQSIVYSLYGRKMKNVLVSVGVG
jgi:hypothetical protein